MNRLYGIVSCDVVDSTSLPMDALIQLRRDIYSSLFPQIEAHCHGFWGRVVRGDTIECCVEQPCFSFRVALLIKCWVKDWAVCHEASPAMITGGVRYSIGIGSMRSVDKEDDFLDGEAIYIAGRNLDRISEKDLPVSFGMYSVDDVVNLLIINNLSLIDRLFESLTERQCLVLFHKLLGQTEKEISRVLEITQTAVNLRAKNAGWSSIKDTLDILEHIDYERYVQ